MRAGHLNRWRSFIEANQPLTYEEFCCVLYGQTAAGLPQRGSVKRQQLEERYRERSQDPFSEIEMYIHQHENQARQKLGFGPIGCNDLETDVLREDRCVELQAALAAMMRAVRFAKMTQEEALAIMRSVGHVAGRTLCEAGFAELLPKLLPRTTALELRKAVVAIGRSAINSRPDSYPWLKRQFDSELSRLNGWTKSGRGR